MALRVVVQPDTFLLSVDEAKAQLNVTFADDDALIEAYIGAAQRIVESLTQRRYCAQTLEWVRDSWCDRMVLPVAPGGDSSKASIVSVKYADTAGVQQTLDAASLYWDVPAGPTRAVRRRWFAIWPWLGDAAERVVIRFQITSAPADASPGVITAMRLLVAHFYAHREAVVGVDNRDSSAPIPFGVEQCLDDERWDA